MGSEFRASTSARLLLALCLAAVVALPLGSAEVNAASALRRVAASGSATGGKRITVRVELTGPAPAGGALIGLSSSSSLIPVPSSVRIQAGEAESTIGVTTVPTAVDTEVTLTARYGGITKSRVVLIKEPVLSSLSVQSKIRAGAQGRVTVRLSGRAPASGLIVNVKSNRPSIVPLPGDVTVAAGKASATVIVDAAMVSKDVPINVIARYDGVRLVASAIVRNYATATPTPTATVTPTSTSTATPTVTATPIPDPRSPIRAAFYYPWFPEAWNQQGINPYTNYHPSADFYDSSDPAVVRVHIEAMQYGKIELGIASWWGADHHTNTRFPTLLAAASGTGFKWAAYYETESLRDDLAGDLRDDLTYLKENYASDPSYYTINGKFVVFVYADTEDGCGMVDRWTEANTVGAYIVLKVFPGYRSCANQPDGWHQYAPAAATSSQSPYWYSISPGFWKVGDQPRLDRDPGRWRQNIRDMIASGAQFQLVISFNEWGEGTGVESATEWATASGYGEYLDALHTDGAEPSPTATPTETASPPNATPTESVTSTPTETATPDPTATSTEIATPEPTETPTVTPTSEPVQIVFTWADNPIDIGQQSSAEMCWINPSPGAGTGELYVMASRGAGALNGSPHLTIVGVPINGVLTASLTMAEPCMTIPVAGEASGDAYLVVELFEQPGFQSSPSVTIANPVASRRMAPPR